MKQQILAGPILRHVSITEFTLWFVTTHRPEGRIQVYHSEQTFINAELTSELLSSIQLGSHCFINLLHVRLDNNQPNKLPLETLLSYQLLLFVDEQQLGLQQLAPQVCFSGHDTPVFSVPSRINRVLHGSCRKPHHPQKDGLLEVDKLLRESIADGASKPDVLIFTGDQVYVDDVAGPMLEAIHQVIDSLGLFDEALPKSDVSSLTDLRRSDKCYYLRDLLLPEDTDHDALLDSFFHGKRKPIFTSIGAHNHLITLSEVIAMYLLVWSDVPWQFVQLGTISDRVSEKYQQRYQQEIAIIEDFKATLANARRPMANIPVYMMFDDHDVTDDWNLTRGWEDAAYSNPFSKRIIGNALLGFLLCQGWGNQPASYVDLREQLTQSFTSEPQIAGHDKLLEQLLNWNQWHFVLNTRPKIVVLDTRTHRWRSESSPGKPSGLMDWESLTELQNELIDQPSVIVVSPAPVFGVKLIETIQKVFTYFGKPLMVDAENWMAHPGSAQVLLNIFHHPKTPPNFIILSGDVHYSFVYDVTLRRRKNSPKILQVTASGFKNAFPDALLKWLDRINLFLYGSESPLNIFTKRRDMRVKRRRPDVKSKRVLFNHAGVGEVLVAEKIENTQVKFYASDGKIIEFK